MTLEENSEIVSAQDYYPYGEILRSYTLGSGANNKYFFTEKERDTETNYDYFGARFYDSELIRWTTIDPLWEKYHGWSPYNYTLNNPLRFIDPDGREAVKSEPEDREGNGEERKKKLKEQQEEKANQDLSTDLLFISAGASGALAGGFNIDGGIIIDTKTGDAKFYFSWGFTAGFGTNAGGSITYKPNSILPENSGLTFNNDSKIEGTAYGVSINVTMNSPDQAFGSNGGGVGGGPKGGAGIFWHNTMLIVTTEKFNIVKGFRGVSENSDSKFWKK
jgi:RHS repeat-associated protein